MLFSCNIIFNCHGIFSPCIPLDSSGLLARGPFSITWCFFSLWLCRNGLQVLVLWPLKRPASTAASRCMPFHDAAECMIMTVQSQTDTSKLARAQQCLQQRFCCVLAAQVAASGAAELGLAKGLQRAETCSSSSIILALLLRCSAGMKGRYGVPESCTHERCKAAVPSDSKHIAAAESGAVVAHTHPDITLWHKEHQGHGKEAAHAESVSSLLRTVPVPNNCMSVQSWGAYVSLSQGALS